MAVGIEAFRDNTLGNRNVGIGYSVLREQTTGDQNLGLGYFAIRNNVTGDDNTCLGSHADGFNAGGLNSHSEMTCVGSHAGYGNQTGSSGVYLGFEAGYNQTTLSDLLIIDNQNRGSAAAEITDALIYGVFNATPASQSLRFNVGTTTWHNAAHSDADGGRASIFNFKGQQSGGEETTLARIEVSHDGTGDDQLAKMVLGVNTGSGVVDVIKMDSGRKTSIGDGGTTDYSQFEADGTYVMKGAATVWNDLVLPLSSARVPASNAPTWTGLIGNLNAYTYGLNDFQEFSTELSHGYKSGSTFEFHVHGALNGSNVDERKIKFEIEYTIADTPAEAGFGDVYPATTTIPGELTIPGSTTDLTAFSINIGTDSTASFIQGAIINGRVRRIASTGTEPTGDPFLTQVGIHVEANTIGTRTQTTK